jgi:hypothetical protein
VGNKIIIYINGVKKAEIADNEAVTNYHKYGNYGTLRTDEAVVRWRRARFYRDGRAPSTAAATEAAAKEATEQEDFNIHVLSNPVTGNQATIQYTLSQPDKVQIAIYNVNGQAEQIVNTSKQAGTHVVQWNTAHKPTGVYVARMMVGRKTKSIKLIVESKR